MKTAARFLAACSAVFIFLACQKEKSYERPGSGNGGNPVAGDFTAVINGAPWSADSIKGAAILQGYISIAGASTGGKQVVMTIAGNSTGTYVLDQQSASGASYLDGPVNSTLAYTSNQGEDSTDAGGTVTISEIDTVAKTLSGSFQFKLFRETDSAQVVITQGVFNKIPYSASLPPAADSDSLVVTIDGQPWRAYSVQSNMNSGKLIVIGTDASASQSVGLAMPDTVQPGTYPLDFYTGNYFGEYNPNSTTFLVSDSTAGTLTILKNNTSTRRISGTFQFTAIDILGGTGQKSVLTQGSFSTGY